MSLYFGSYLYSQYYRMSDFKTKTLVKVNHNIPFTASILSGRVKWKKDRRASTKPPRHSRQKWSDSR